MPAAPVVCVHGVRWPHECHTCAGQPSDAEIDRWMSSQGLCNPHSQDAPNRASRPECWTLAMEYLGEPDATAIERYVADLEERVGTVPAAGVVTSLPVMLWPAERAVGRAEDMGQGHLRLSLDASNDVCVEVFDGRRFARIEFCNPGGGGGGRSARTRLALIELMRAIEADNDETPALTRPERP